MSQKRQNSTFFDIFSDGRSPKEDLECEELG